MAELDTFSKAFKEFIKPYNCHLHKIAPTFVCIDPKCQAKGMICSKCLTISGPHKNHDSIDVSEFLEHCLKASGQNDPKRDEMTDLIRRIDEEFEDLLKILTDFHESISTVIKTYISKKNDFHTEK